MTLLVHGQMSNLDMCDASFSVQLLQLAQSAQRRRYALQGNYLLGQALREKGGLAEGIRHLAKVCFTICHWRSAVRPLMRDAAYCHQMSCGIHRLYSLCETLPLTMAVA